VGQTFAIEPHAIDLAGLGGGDESPAGGVCQHGRRLLQHGPGRAVHSRHRRLLWGHCQPTAAGSSSRGRGDPARPLGALQPRCSCQAVPDAAMAPEVRGHEAPSSTQGHTAAGPARQRHASTSSDSPSRRAGHPAPAASAHAGARRQRPPCVRAAACSTPSAAPDGPATAADCNYDDLGVAVSTQTGACQQKRGPASSNQHLPCPCPPPPLSTPLPQHPPSPTPLCAGLLQRAQQLPRDRVPRQPPL